MMPVGIFFSPVFLYFSLTRMYCKKKEGKKTFVKNHEKKVPVGAF